MTINIINIVLFFLITIFFTLLISCKSNEIGLKFKIFDEPDTVRKIHANKIPQIAAIPLLFIVCSLFMVDLCFVNLFEKTIAYIFLTSVFVFMVGFFDDKFNLSPLSKTFYLTIIIILTLLIEENLIIEKVYISTLDTFLHLNHFSFFLTIICIFGFMNMFNFIDGINGLAVFLSILYLTIMLIIFNDFLIFKNFNFFSYFIILLILNLLIILIFNYKGKYFLGDSGSLFISYVISLMIIYNLNMSYKKGIVRFDVSAEQFLIIFLIPFIDMMRLIVQRIVKKKSPFLGDRNHLHHLIFYYFNKNLAYTLTAYSLICMVPILASVFLSKLGLEIIFISTLIYWIIYFKFKKFEI